MPEPGAENFPIHEIVIRLNTTDFQIFEKYRGELSPDAFVSALLRMIDTGAVRDTPSWAQGGDPPAKP